MSGARRTVHAIPAVVDLLDFEEMWPRWSSQKDEAIRARFGIPPARYFQLLIHAIDAADAEQARPMTVHRLRSLRDRGEREHQRRVG